MSKQEPLYYRTCFYHLLCIGAVAALLSTLQAESSDISVYIPMATQIGIILAIGLQQCALVLCRRVRRLLLSLLDALQLLFLATLNELRRLLTETGSERLPT